MTKLAILSAGLSLLATTAFAAPLKLEWKCDAHSVVKGNLLIVSVERNDKKVGNGSARADIDLSPYCGKMVEIKAKCIGFDIGRAKQSHHGSKLMLHYRDMEEFGWDWSYHAFREYAGWSVEHEGEDSKSLRPSADTPRMRALLRGFNLGRARR